MLTLAVDQIWDGGECHNDKEFAAGHSGQSQSLGFTEFINVHKL